MSDIRVVVAEDQHLVRSGLCMLLAVERDITVVGEAANGEEAVAVATAVQPDVVLMDIRMPVMDGITATHHLRMKLPAARVLLLTTFNNDEYLSNGLQAGAVGYLLKDADSPDLLRAIRAAARGESFFQPTIATKVAALARLPQPVTGPEPLGPAFSEREQAIVRLLATGATNKEIAATLMIAEGTVKNHVTNILEKLQVRDRTQAALKAKELHLL